MSEQKLAIHKISHEFHTSVNSILGFLHLIGQDELKPRQQLHLQRIEGLIQHLLGNFHEVIELCNDRNDSLASDPKTLVQNHKTILLAEDDENNQIVATELLERKGYQILLAKNGLEVLGLLEQCKSALPDLILMDLQMPILDGIGAIKFVRQNPLWKAIPIISMTADAQDGIVKKMIELGANAHISKPFIPQELYRIVQHWIEAKSI